jgi:hypothetical protein
MALGVGRTLHVICRARLQRADVPPGNVCANNRHIHRVSQRSALISCGRYGKFLTSIWFLSQTSPESTTGLSGSILGRLIAKVWLHNPSSISRYRIARQNASNKCQLNEYDQLQLPLSWVYPAFQGSPPDQGYNCGKDCQSA